MEKEASLAKTEETKTVGEEIEEFVGTPTRWEVSFFLKDPKGAKCCVKGIGDASVLDDAKTVVDAFYAQGFEPEYPKGAPAQEPAKPASPGEAAAGSQLPEKKPCPVHAGAFLYRKTNAKGTWYSHKAGDAYCNGK